MFDESILLKCLTERAEDARILRRVFRVEWLNNVSYRPVLKTIYDFLDEYKIPPTFSTIHQIFRDYDESLYEARYKGVIEELEKVQYSVSDVLYIMKAAKNVAMARSLKDLYSSAQFTSLIQEDEGTEILKEIETWKLQFQESADETELDIRQAILKTIQYQNEEGTDPITTGISVLDEFSGGGIKPKNLAIVMAPLKNGKSITLMNIAYNISLIQDKEVLFITNELTTEETAERFVSRITGLPCSQMQVDISSALGHPALVKYWDTGLQKKLRILENVSEFSTDYIESAIEKYFSLYSWKPKVVVIDYMERMKPTVSGIKRGSTWDWMGAIGRDLMRMAKRHNVLVWTAIQSNRSGFNSNTQLNASSAQGSIKHLQECSFAVGQRKRKTSQGTVLEFEPISVRFAKDSERVFCQVDWSTMKIGEEIKLSAFDLLDVEKAEKNAWKDREEEDG